MKKSAFTLVELLVVIAIIGMLVGLLLPAVQQAREAARRMQCSNNLKNLALACLNHEASMQEFPSGGWCWYWIGDPDRGFGPMQSGSWTYSILPYIEQNALFQLGADNEPDNVTNTQKNGAATCLATPLSVFNCPSRRTTKSYPFFKSGNLKNCGKVSDVAKGDYAANIGVSQYGENFGNFQPSSVSEGSKLVQNHSYPSFEPNGVIYAWSSVTLGMVRDGTSNTYLIGEKWLNPDFYEVCKSSSYDAGDNENLYSGGCNDTLRTCYYKNDSANARPAQDRRGITIYKEYFGSVHAGSCSFTMCDGSVQNVSYSIDPQTHYYLGHRSDGQVATLLQ
ncbi:MAG: DUF1559 domain-containing protein [Planctomycetia bacterium]|nr:DUF1559 domain-containing protein [Planctomycetia bacterium]